MVKGNQVSPAKGKKEDARYQTDVPRTRRSFFQSDITGNRRPPPMFQPRLYPPRYPLIRAMDVFSKSGKRNEKKKKKNVLLLLLHLIESKRSFFFSNSRFVPRSRKESRKVLYNGIHMVYSKRT